MFGPRRRWLILMISVLIMLFVVRWLVVSSCPVSIRSESYYCEASDCDYTLQIGNRSVGEKRVTIHVYGGVSKPLYLVKTGVSAGKHSLSETIEARGRKTLRGNVIFDRAPDNLRFVLVCR